MSRTLQYFYADANRERPDDAALIKEFERIRKIIRENYWPVIERNHVVELCCIAVFYNMTKGSKPVPEKEVSSSWKKRLSKLELKSLCEDIRSRAVTLYEEYTNLKSHPVVAASSESNDEPTTSPDSSDHSHEDSEASDSENNDDNDEKKEKDKKDKKEKKKKEKDKKKPLPPPPPPHRAYFLSRVWVYVQLASTMRTSGVKLFPARLLPRSFAPERGGKPAAQQSRDADGFVRPPQAAPRAQAGLAQLLQEIASRKRVLLGVLPDCSLLLLDAKGGAVLHRWPITHVRGVGTKRVGHEKAFLVQTHGVKEPLVFVCAGAKVFAAFTAQTQALRRKASSEKSTLASRLEVLGFVTRDVDGDGNCQFRAVADQLWRDEARHRQVREAAVGWLAANKGGPPDPAMGPDFALANFVDSEVFADWGAVVKYYSKDASWGDHLTLVAIANHFQVSVVVYSSLQDAPQAMIEPTPKPKKPQTIYLYHWHGVHYGSLEKIKKKK